MSTQQIDLVVSGGDIVGSSSVYRGDIAIQGGKIASIGSAEQWPSALETIDARGKQIFPGVIDVHTHCRNFSHHVDSFQDLSRSGAYGGVTSMLTLVMIPPRTDMMASTCVDHFINLEGRECLLDFGFHAGLYERDGILQDISKVVELGVTSFKFMMGYKKRGITANDRFIFEAMKRVARAGGLSMVHCEDGEMIDSQEKEMIAAGRVGFRDFYPTRPNLMEEIAVLKAIAMAELSGSPLYIVHLSAAEALGRIKVAHGGRRRIWVETCPQYMLLTDDLMETMGPLSKVGPPLRTKADNDAMWEGVSNGWITVIGSDHSAHTRETKKPGYTNIFDAWFGCPGIETTLPLMYSEAIGKRGLPPWFLARVLSENPARIFGLYPRKGVIQVGSDADLVIIDPRKVMIIRAKEQHTNADYSLYEGWEVKGVPVLSLLRGRVLLKDGQLMQEYGCGKYIKRQPFDRSWERGKSNIMSCKE